MRTRIYKIIKVIFCCLPVIANAQQDSTRSKINFRIGAYFNSHLNYYGRTDSLRSSGFFSMAEIWLGNKFYINAAPVFTHNNREGFQYAGAVTTAGYLNNNGKSSIHAYFVRPIYKANSGLVQSALKSQMAINFTELNKIINITAGADIKFSNNVDYGASMGLDHIFKKPLAGNFILVVDPSVCLYAGTQRFIETRHEQNSFLIFPGIEKEINEEKKKFNVLSYEASLPVILAKGKWILLTTPSFVVPLNLIKIEGRPDLSERGQNMFYVTAGIRYSFR